MARVVIVLALLAASASAQPRRVDVIGEACDASALADDVAKLDGEVLDASASASVRVELVAPFGARVSFVAGDGTIAGPRVIEAQSCDELVTSIALVIAMTPTAAPSPPPPRAPIRYDAALEVTRSVVVAAPAVVRWDAIVGGAGSVDAGGPEGRLAIGVCWRRGDRSLGAELRGDLPDDRTLAVGRIDVLRAELAVTPCLHRGELAACALAAAGVWRGAGIGLLTERAVLAPVATLGVRIAWERGITGWLALRAYLDADALVTTTRFDVDAMPVWTSPRVEAIAGLSLLARFL